MNRLYRPLLVLAVFAGLAAAGWVSAYATSALQAQPTALAVVDMQKVFNDSSEKKQIEADINRLGEQNEVAKNDMVAKLRGMDEDLKLIHPNETQQLEDKRKEIRRAAVQMKVEYEARRQEIGREGVIRIENLYRKILSAAGDVAETNGYDLVLYKETEDMLNAENFQQIINMISARKVLWSSEEVDITEQVSTRLNTAFGSGTQ